MKKKNDLLFLTVSAVFIAIIAVLSLTPLGYLKVGIIEITFMVLPVALGGILLGKWEGLLLGTAFGVTSLIQCFGMSPFGTALFGISPAGAVVVCLAPRMALGFFSAWLFEALSKTKLPVAVGAGLSGLCASLINTVGFVGLTLVLFGRTQFVVDLMEQSGAANLFAFALVFAGFNRLVEAGVNTFLSAAVGPVLARLKKRMR